MNLCITYDTIILFLGIYQTELYVYVHHNTCIRARTAVLFIVAKNT